MRGILVRFLLVLTLVIGGSYLFEIPYLGAAILVTAVSFIGAVITDGEYMPGEVDNPDGIELHPFKLLAGIVVIFILLLSLGYLFPNLYGFGAYAS
jgi:quinol-cytochrome oxidoreductase complex cytochrome b subunit